MGTGAAHIGTAVKPRQGTGGERREPSAFAAGSRDAEHVPSACADARIRLRRERAMRRFESRPKSAQDSMVASPNGGFEQNRDRRVAEGAPA
jgi:hypothetical protein